MHQLALTSSLEETAAMSNLGKKGAMSNVAENAKRNSKKALKEAKNQLPPMHIVLQISCNNVKQLLKHVAPKFGKKTNKNNKGFDKVMSL